jgi:WD40 repeat protein
MKVPDTMQQGSRRAFALAPDGRTAALGLEDGTARLWNLATGREVRTFSFSISGKSAREVAVMMLAYSPDGKRLLTGGWDHMIRVLDPAGRREERVLKGHASSVEALAVSADGKNFASGG